MLASAAEIVNFKCDRSLTGFEPMNLEQRADSMLDPAKSYNFFLRLLTSVLFVILFALFNFFLYKIL